VRTIVSDASPINYLILIGEVEILANLFEEVLIPPAVHLELQNSRTPPTVYAWAASLPSWARVLPASRIAPGIDLGAGETEAISLAIELGIFAILMDERKGRLAAEQRGLVPLGTLNVLESADIQGLLDFEEAVAKLRKTNFHVDPMLVDARTLQVRSRKKS
jgi:predicted nucleic acid-binding protein